MFKKLNLMALVFILSFLTGTAFAGDPITPFGSLAWDDGLLDTVNKLNQMKGLEQIELVTKEERTDLKGASENSLNSILSGLLENKFGSILNAKNDRRAGMIFETYKDKAGTDQKYTERIWISIEAYPIMICDTPFTITLLFSRAEGLAIQHTDKVMIEKKWGTAFPLVLTMVTLVSKSPRIADNYKEIDTVLEKKYKPYDKSGIRMSVAGGHLDGCVYETEGTKSARFCVKSSSSEYTISYFNKAYLATLAEIYRRHLADLENKRTKGKSDKSSDL